MTTQISDISKPQWQYISAQGRMISTCTSTPDLIALLSSSSSHPTRKNFPYASQKLKKGEKEQHRGAAGVRTHRAYRPRS